MKKFETLQDLVDMMDAEVHMNLKTAVETGRWANGERLSEQQREHCLQAIIIYEQSMLPEHERVGYIDRSGLRKTLCDDGAGSSESEQPRSVRWLGDSE